MASDSPRKILDTESLIVGYAMSRLDTAYLKARGVNSWKAAFVEAGQALSKRPTTFNHLRDEFDPYHENPRRGWHNRSLRPTRQRVLEDLYSLSDAALIALISRILEHETNEISEVLGAMATPTEKNSAVAERLLTGYRAEDFFLQNCGQLIQVPTENILDMRLSAQGFDFGVKGRPEWAIEVKGLKRLQGNVQFTDREWTEAGRRRENYWLVIVGNLAEKPVPQVVLNPYEKMTAVCTIQTTIAAVWRSKVFLLS